MKETFNVGI